MSKENIEQKKDRLSELFKQMDEAENKMYEWQGKFLDLEAEHNILKDEIQKLQKHER